MIGMLLASQGLRPNDIVKIALGSVIRRVWAINEPAISALLPSVREEVGSAMSDKNYRTLLKGVGSTLFELFEASGQSPEYLANVVKDVVRMSSPTFRKIIDNVENGIDIGKLDDETAEKIICDVVTVIAARDLDISNALEIPGADIERYRAMIAALRAYVDGLEGNIIFPDLDGLLG